jgi:xylose isomerase
MGLPDLRHQAKRLTPDELVAHLKSFQLDLKFSAGIWYMSPAASRFHAKYGRDLSIEERLEIAASLADEGLRGIEAHYPNEINEDNLHLWKTFAKDTGIKIISVVPLLFYDEQFEFGSLSSPIPTVRRIAIRRTIQTLELNRVLDTDFTIVWTGIDGYENPFGMDFIAARDRFAEGLAEAMDSVPGCRIAFEPKPYEPRGRSFTARRRKAFSWP